ncbi:MAG TPA: hypothetical protein VJL35_00705 [Gemmatimonadaceae bacterium]|nr:hypothetical protein [Gemmatimonadaceae bacterium]
MSIERRLESLEAIVGRQPPIPYGDVKEAELRLSGGVPVRDQLGSGAILRADYAGRTADEELVERFYSQYRTRRDVRAWFIKKIEAIAERLNDSSMRER